MYGTVVILPRVSIRRTPLSDGQLRLVPKVSVLERYDCIVIRVFGLSLFPLLSAGGGGGGEGGGGVQACKFIIL